MPASSSPTPFLTLRWKFFYVVAAVVVMSGGLSAILGTRMNAALREEHANKARALALNLATNAEEPILIDNRANLSTLLAASREGDHEVVYAFALDRQGKVIGHSFKGGFPPELLGKV